MELQVHHYVQSRLTERNQGYKQCLNKLPWIKTLKTAKQFLLIFQTQVWRYMPLHVLEQIDFWAVRISWEAPMRVMISLVRWVCSFILSTCLSCWHIRQRDHLKCGPLTTSPSISQFKLWKQPVLIQKHPSWEQSTFLYKQFNSYTTQSTYRNFQLHLIFWFMSKKKEL